jgi:hypothetical protein
LKKSELSLARPGQNRCIVNGGVGYENQGMAGSLGDDFPVFDIYNWRSMLVETAFP